MTRENYGITKTWSEEKKQAILNDTRSESIIARELGVSQTTLQRFRNKYRKPSIDLTDALIEKGNGAIQNGSNMAVKIRAPKPVRYEDRHKPVVIERQGIGKWSCDSCRTRGMGGEQLLAHSGKTNHRVYSPIG